MSTGNGHEKLAPESTFIKFTTIGQSISGRVLDPQEEIYQGKTQTRHRIELEDGTVKTLPANAYLVGGLNNGVKKYGAGNFWVTITYTKDAPSKKGNPQKIFDIEVLDVVSKSEASEAADQFEQTVPR